MHTPQDVIESALRWQETPYQHQGRLLGIGVDCIGLVFGVCDELALCEYRTSDYARIPNGEFLKAKIEELCGEPYLVATNENPIRLEEIDPGSLLLFRIRTDPQHCAISLQNGSMIHAFQSANYVRAHVIDEKWLYRLIAAYHLPNVNYG